MPIKSLFKAAGLDKIPEPRTTLNAIIYLEKEVNYYVNNGVGIGKVPCKLVLQTKDGGMCLSKSIMVSIWNSDLRKGVCLPGKKVFSVTNARTGDSESMTSNTQEYIIN